MFLRMCLSVCVLQNDCVSSSMCVYVCGFVCVYVCVALPLGVYACVCNSLHVCAACVCVRVYNLNVYVCAPMCVFVQFVLKTAAVCACLSVCVCLPACSVAMMALFRMIDVLEGAARSSGWARASV